MKTTLQLLITLVVLALLAGCAQAGEPAVFTPTAPVEGPKSPADAPAPTTVPLAADRARQLLAERLGIAADQLRLNVLQQAEWTDSCLGLGGPAESCLAAITPGFTGVFAYGDQYFEFRTNEDGSAVRFLPDAIAAARLYLADEVDLYLQDLTLVDFSETTWPDGCLGVHQPDVMCTQATVPGYLVRFQAEDQVYEVHTDLTGERAVLAQPEAGEAGAVEAARQLLAQQLGVPGDQIRLQMLDEAEFSDSCLGLGGPAESCLAVITPGFTGVLEYDGQLYEFRASQDGENVRFLPEPVSAARQLLAADFGLDLQEITLVSVTETEWPDSCLGVHRPEVMCAQVITPGFNIRLEAGGVIYEVHTDQTGRSLVLAQQQEETFAGDPLIAWQSPVEPCLTAEVFAQGLRFGPCEADLVQAQFVVPARAGELEAYLREYAAFEAETPAGFVRFNGMGERTATSAEQRMLAEWAALVLEEAQTGSREPVSALALEWHREGGLAGFCDDLVILRTGAFTLRQCEAEASGRLSADALQDLYTWLDRYAAFEVENRDSAAADAMTTRLVFAGEGQQPAGDAASQEILDFSAAQHAGLSQAARTLSAYFANLRAGDYTAAAELYGGSSEVLQGYNPDLPAGDLPALLERACTLNGFRCDLSAQSPYQVVETRPDRYRITVEFVTPSGQPFELGPCCGAENGSSQTQFTFNVTKTGDQFLVQDLPVYIP